MRLFLRLLFVLAPLITVPAQGQNYITAFAAYERGDYAAALKEFEPLAKRGSVLAQYQLGLMYVNGEGVTQDYRKAVQWFNRAATAGYPPAQTSLGVRFEKGQGVNANYKEAVKWYRFGANQGDANAQYRLGRLYVLGHGVRRDYVEALSLFNLAAAQGVEDAATARNSIAAHLEPEQVAAAERKARERSP